MQPGMQQQQMMMQPGMVQAQPMMMQQQVMTRGVGVLAPYHELFVSQTRRGCFQELMGCEANNEFLIATAANPQNTIMYALEEASCCMRFLCAGQRPSHMTVITGGKPASDEEFLQKKGTTTVMSYDRPFACPFGSCKCCCFQEMTFFDDSNQPIGSIKEDCWYCVPSMSVNDKAGTKVYGISMPRCCNGMCVNCCAEGCCNLRIPYYIFDANGYDTNVNVLFGMSPPANEKGGKNGKKYSQITKIWSGFTNEMFSDADKFEVEFPTGANPEMKAALLGSVFFLNMNFFEKQNNDGGGA